MMVGTHLIAAAVILALAPPPPAQVPPQTVVVVGEKPEPVDKVECKAVNTGTLIARRVCLTQSQWADTKQRSDDQLRVMRDWQRMRCRNGMGC